MFIGGVREIGTIAREFERLTPLFIASGSISRGVLREATADRFRELRGRAERPRRGSIVAHCRH